MKLSYKANIFRKPVLYIKNLLMMNIRKIKLALAVDLLNLNAPVSPLFHVKKVMKQFREDAGNFRGLLETGKARLTENIERKSVTLYYENCTVDLDLIYENQSLQPYVQRFELKQAFTW